MNAKFARAADIARSSLAWAVAFGLGAAAQAQKAPGRETVNIRQQIAGPEYAAAKGAMAVKSPAQLAAWLDTLEEQRVQSKDRYGLNGADHEKPELS